MLFGGRWNLGFPLLRISVAEIGHSILDIFAIMFTFVGKWVRQELIGSTNRPAICACSDSQHLKTSLFQNLRKVLSVESLSVEFSARPLFREASFVVNTKDRIALVGKNGAGKSTLLKILAGLQAPTSGNVALQRGVTVGYLPQVMVLADECTVLEETEKAFGHVHQMQAELEQLNNELAERTDYETPDYMELVEIFTHKSELYQMIGGMNYRAEMERTLLGLGFSTADFTRPTKEFSGGWRMRIELAKLLLQRPDVLLLDEPTNHLDIESIRWLERFLQRSGGAVILVSHDRAFINNVTNRTLEISCGKIVDYKVSYDEFVKLRAERREQQLRAYEKSAKGNCGY
jgi:ATP-binding cassette subfamily F protein 3